MTESTKSFLLQASLAALCIGLFYLSGVYGDRIFYRKILEYHMTRYGGKQNIEMNSFDAGYFLIAKDKSSGDTFHLLLSYDNDSFSFYKFPRGHAPARNCFVNIELQTSTEEKGK